MYLALNREADMFSNRQNSLPGGTKDDNRYHHCLVVSRIVTSGSDAKPMRSMWEVVTSQVKTSITTTPTGQAGPQFT
jgi:hypothetical protein